MSVETYYDIRGRWRLDRGDIGFGSMSVPEELQAPYLYAENMIKSASTKGSFLDLCCGDGVHSIFPAVLGYSVTGVDLSSKSIEAANWLASTHSVKDHCQFFADDALRFLGSREQEFDWVFISGSLYYFDLDLILPSILASLKPGGHFICIGTNGDNSLANSYRGLKQKLTQYRDEATMSRLLTRSEWNKMQQHFSSSELKFFCFFSLLAKVFPKKWGLRQLAAGQLEKLDKWVLRLPGCWRLGFKYLFWGKKDG